MNVNVEEGPDVSRDQGEDEGHEAIVHQTCRKSSVSQVLLVTVASVSRTSSNCSTMFALPVIFDIVPSGIVNRESAESMKHRVQLLPWTDTYSARLSKEGIFAGPLALLLHDATVTHLLVCWFGGSSYGRLVVGDGLVW